MALAASPRDTASHFFSFSRIYKKYTLHIHTAAKRSTLGAFDIRGLYRYSGFQAGVNTPAIIIIIIIIIPYGGINSRMTSYLKFPVLIDFPFQDAIFPFNRAAPLSHGC